MDVISTVTSSGTAEVWAVGEDCDAAQLRDMRCCGTRRLSWSSRDGTSESQEGGVAAEGCLKGLLGVRGGGGGTEHLRPPPLTCGAQNI